MIVTAVESLVITLGLILLIVGLTSAADEEKVIDSLPPAPFKVIFMFVPATIFDCK